MREPLVCRSQRRLDRGIRVLLCGLGVVVGVGAVTACESSDARGAGFTFEGELQPLLLSHCGACHAGQSQGGSDFAGVYTELLKPSGYCLGEPVFRCVLVRVQDGSMPQGAGCTGDPILDAKTAACLSSAEQQILEVWVLDGAPES